MNMRLIYRVFLSIVLILVVIGITMVLGATSGVKRDYSMIINHLSKVLFALGAFILGMFTPYEKYRKFTKGLMMLVIVLLIFTLLVGLTKKGASRWINLGFFSFQPSELAKIAIVMHLSNLIDRKGELIKDFKKGYLPSLFWIFLTAFLIVLQPNLSTAGLIIATGLSLLFVSGARNKHLIFTSAIVLLIGIAVMMSFSHGRARIYSFLGIGEKKEISIQSYQANIALGSGGLTGRGLAQNRQSDEFLPEAYGDFIYAIIGEQFGFIGTVTVLLIFIILMFLGIYIAYKCTDRYGQLLAFGLTLVICLNAFVNMAVVSGAWPVTGITLPFISYGGTAIITFGYTVGVVVNIAIKNAKEQDANLKMAQDNG